jgi:Ankyrin repeat
MEDDRGHALYEACGKPGDSGAATVRQILATGVEPSDCGTETGNGDTAAHAACGVPAGTGGNPECIKLLADAGFDINAGNTCVCFS